MKCNILRKKEAQSSQMGHLEELAVEHEGTQGDSDGAFMTTPARALGSESSTHTYWMRHMVCTELMRARVSCAEQGSVFTYLLVSAASEVTGSQTQGRRCRSVAGGTK